MSQDTKESHLGENTWKNDVEPRLIKVKEALTTGLTIYGYQETDTDESTTTYLIKNDGIYCTIQKKPVNIVFEEKKILSKTEKSTVTEKDLISQVNNLPITKKVRSFNKPQSLYFIKKSDNQISCVSYIYPSNEVFIGTDLAKIKPATKETILTLNTDQEYIFNADETKNLLNYDRIRKNQHNVIQIYRKNQREKSYKVVQADLSACEKAQLEIEALIKIRADQEFSKLLTKLKTDNEKCVQQNIKKSVFNLLCKVESMDSSNPEYRPKLLEVLESLEALLDPKENLADSTENFNDLAQSMAGAGNKELQETSNAMLTLSAFLATYAILSSVVVIILLASSSPSYLALGYMATHMGFLSDGLMCSLTCTGAIPAAMGAGATGIIGFSFFAASRPTGLPKAMLDVCDAVEKDTKLVSSNMQILKT